MKRLSIRWQITAYYAAYMLLILIGLSTLVLRRVHHHLLDRADQALEEEIDELVEELQYFEDRVALLDELERRYSVHSHFHFQILDDQLATFFQSRFLTNVKLPTAEKPSTMRGKQFSDIELPGLGSFRLMKMAIRDSNSEPMLLRALASRADFDRDFQSYLWMFLTLIPIAVAISLVSGYLLARHLLSPIQQIGETVNRITADRMNERLQVINPHDELGELSTALNRTFDRLEESMQSMRRFTSDAAHELRSPVSVLRAEAEIALRKPRDLEEYRKVVEVTLNETVRLGTIIDQLLALCRHDAGLQKLLTDEVPVAAVLLDVVARFHSFALQKEIDIVVKSLPECFIHGHDVLISQLFYNLIDNALKFTEKKGRIIISGSHSNGHVEFTITDTGIGIATEHLPLVFERFYRADAAREHYRGVGLGLSICKSIVDAHQGTITVTSNVGKGTVFTVRFPTLSSIESYDEAGITDDSSQATARSSSLG